MPAEKSKNSLPSTSVTTMPRPLFATSGYERVYDGEIYFSSPSSTRLALGPGRAVLILGFRTSEPMVAVMVCALMKSSVRQWSLVRGQLSVNRTSGASSGSSVLALKWSAKANQAEDGINRYRIRKDADAKAD